MSNIEHTPGPWHTEPLQEDEGKSIAICKAARGIIAVIEAPAPGETTDFRREEDEANARLIVCAPAQAVILDLVRYGMMTLTEGDAEFDGTIYAFDDRQPDWRSLVDAIGWDAARTAIAKIKAA